MNYNELHSQFSAHINAIGDHWLGSFSLNILAYSTVLIPLYLIVAYVKRQPNARKKCEYL